jgi:hypothetical protein
MATANRRASVGAAGKTRKTASQSRAKAKAGTVADPNSSASAKKRGEVTKARMKRTRQAQNAAVRKTAAKKVAKKAAVKAGAKTLLRAAGPPGIAAAVAHDAMKAAKKYGGPGGKAVGKRVNTKRGQKRTKR